MHPGALDGVETSDHLARLWASDRIDALMHPASGAPPSAADQKEALALAARYHLVTAVSGAVVLDSQADDRRRRGQRIRRSERPDGSRTGDLGVARAGRGAAAGGRCERDGGCVAAGTS